MANAIETFKAYIDLLDEVYKMSSLSSTLDGNPDLVGVGSNAKEIVIPKIDMQGLGDYSRNSGYLAGDVTLTNETVECNYDRGRKFTIDAMDNVETAGVAFGKLSSEFIRTKVVPELDSFRFAKLATKAGTTKQEAIATGADVQSSLIEAQNKMDEDEVPTEGRILFITPSLYNAFANLDTTKSREVLSSFSQVVKVPQSRFSTSVKLNDGKTAGEENGGFVAKGTNINFLIVEKSAVIQFQKHTVSKIIAPEENQTSDGWTFCYRDYGIVDVYENKTAGIYCSCVEEVEG